MTRRVLGAVLLFCAGLLTRQTLLESGRNIRRTRRELAEAFAAMAAEIEALLTPMPMLLQRNTGRSVVPFFDSVRQGLLHGWTLAEAWRHAARELTLSAEEREQVAGLGSRLDGTEENVCAALRLTAGTLQKNNEKSMKNLSETERLVSSICVCISLLLGILLF